jgi:hypothetical protein
MALVITPVTLALMNMSSPTRRSSSNQQKQAKAGKQSEVAGFDGARAYTYLVEQSKLGPRISGTEANQKLRDRMAQHFKDCGGEVTRQPFEAPHPITGNPVAMENIVGSWNTDQPRRVVIGAHFDTRPNPDEETNPRRKNMVFLGANDGGSGIAVLMELANMLPNLKTSLGVDLAAFDAEELIIDKKGEYFLGSKVFAEEYRRKSGAGGGQARYVAGIVVDLVGGDPLAIYPDREGYRQNPQLVEEIWAIAGRLKATGFKRGNKFYDVSDDHLPLIEVGIPAIDIIDFSYKHWHLASDTADKCSAASLAQVGGVVAEWLRGK